VYFTSQAEAARVVGVEINALERESMTFARIEAGLIRLHKELRSGR
jgi:hypothetical protein